MRQRYFLTCYFLSIHPRSTKNTRDRDISSLCILFLQKVMASKGSESSPEVVKKFSTGKTLHSLGFTPPDKPSHIKSLVKTQQIEELAYIILYSVKMFSVWLSELRYITNPAPVVQFYSTQSTLFPPACFSHLHTSTCKCWDSYHA